MPNGKSGSEWDEARKRCRLDDNDIRMAKELGMAPKSLIKNNPSPQQKWKAPVKEWIHGLYWKRFPEKAALHEGPGQVRAGPGPKVRIFRDRVGARSR